MDERVQSFDGELVTVYSETCPDCGRVSSLMADTAEHAAASLFRMMDYHRRVSCGRPDPSKCGRCGRSMIEHFDGHDAACDNWTPNDGGGRAPDPEAA